ncbi:MAG: amidohydrolase family protein, partial [Planctomycetaceae bacterium]|nr:amidohydrolase family protein [Planctomycetaceae bacterium]
SRGGSPATAASASGGRGAASASSTSAGRPAADTGASGSSSRTDLWKAIRDGEQPLFVNVNNAAAILHTLAATKENNKVKVTFIASGADIYRVIDQLDPKKHTVVIPPRLETIPNSQNLINVPKMLVDAKIPFMFSTSLGQSEFRAQQDAPLFAVGLLVRGGLASERALSALTMGPAKLLGLEKEIGSLETGKQANFIILDNAPFGVSTGVCAVYVEGKPIYESH